MRGRKKIHILFITIYFVNNNIYNFGYCLNKSSISPQSSSKSVIHHPKSHPSPKRSSIIQTINLHPNHQPSSKPSTVIQNVIRHPKRHPSSKTSSIIQNVIHHPKRHPSSKHHPTSSDTQVCRILRFSGPLGLKKNPENVLEETLVMGWKHNEEGENKHHISLLLTIFPFGSLIFLSQRRNHISMCTENIFCLRFTSLNKRMIHQTISTMMSLHNCLHFTP